MRSLPYFLRQLPNPFFCGNFQVHKCLWVIAGLSPSVLAQDLAGESVLLNLQSEEYFQQNEVATRMFFLLTSSESIEQAYQLLLNESDVEPQQLKQNLLQFVEKLVGAGLVEVTAV